MATETIPIQDLIVYESSHNGILFSPLMPTKRGFALVWKQWKPRILTLYSDGRMIYRKTETSPIKATFILSKVLITYMDSSLAAAVAEGETNEPAEIERGITVKCTTKEGVDTYFRCIFELSELEKFKSAVEAVATEVKYSNTVLTDNMKMDLANTSPSAVASPTTSPKVGLSILGARRSKKPAMVQLPNQSIMRSTIAYQMDRFDLLSTHDRIVARRGEFKWLPVLFANDLVHGSWWFVIGSVCFVVAAIVMVCNSYHTSLLDMGEDDSGLSPVNYRATWYLMIFSGYFSTLGSLGFVRAVHEDPPMVPLFRDYYHFQNDELLGSWLFLLATVPMIPYCLIYLSNDHYNSLVYLGGLVIAFLLVLGTFLFVRACYPNDKKRKNILKPVSRVLCYCFCTRRWMKRHLANDWLAGTWFILWASLLATVACFVLFIAALASMDNLKIFLMGTTFFENFAFLVGSAYFVAGSYPESSLLVEDDFDHDHTDDIDPAEDNEYNNVGGAGADSEVADGDGEEQEDIESAGGSGKQLNTFASSSSGGISKSSNSSNRANPAKNKKNSSGGGGSSSVHGDKVYFDLSSDSPVKNAHHTQNSSSASAARAREPASADIEMNIKKPVSQVGDEGDDSNSDEEGGDSPPPSPSIVNPLQGRGR